MKIKVFLFAFIIFWGLLVLVSVNHLFPFSGILQISSLKSGLLAWSAFGMAVAVLGHRFWKELSFVFILFFMLGWSVGPFLEPPGDPLDHLAGSYSTCGKTSADIPQSNKGLWQYSMVGNILCHDRYSLPPTEVLKRIDLANGVFWAFSASILFIVGLRAGLPSTWAFFSVCLAFLFMGTNRFSYFSYYSFAPSFTSMWIYWLWIAAFFFKQDGRYVLPGIVAAGLCLPILLVNHIQEALFLSLVCAVWVLYFLVRSVALYLSDNHHLWRNSKWWLFLAVLFVIFFGLPQCSVFQEGLLHLFIRDNWQAYQQTLVSWKGLHFIGKIWAYHVQDTLGFFGFLPVLLIPLFVLPKVIEQNHEQKWQILLLGLLPFAVYCIPLLNFVWTSNLATTDVYYRACYNSLFWLPVALVLCNLGGHVQNWFPWHSLRSNRMLNGFFLLFCLLSCFLLGSVQSGPIYGKLDFITVDSKKWWDVWRPMIEKVVSWKKEEIETDYITGYVLYAVFNLPLKHNRHSQVTYLFAQQIPKRTVSTMIQNSIDDDRTGCLINLHGFQPTWVPFFTGHWSPYWSKPGQFYQFDKKEGRLVNYLQEKTPGNCYVFF